MAEKVVTHSQQDPEFVALERVYSALKPLDAAKRESVVASAYALLGMHAPDSSQQRSQIGSQSRAGSRTGDQPPPPAASDRPTSLVELVQQRKPTTNAQRIAVFAYYREKSEGQPRFSRDDLKTYFAKAKITPSANYDRDFVEAVRKGWIHEDATDSYVTSKGLEAVESEFAGERKYTKPTGRAARPRPKKRPSTPGRKKSGKQR